MTQSTVTRIWDTTLERIDNLQDVGVIPPQLKGDPARVDFIVDQWVKLLAKNNLSHSIREAADKLPDPV